MVIMSNYVNVEYREHIGPWLNAHGLTGSAVEIGCAFGGYARQVLADWKGQKYFMVDLWARQPQEVYREKTEGINYDGWYRDCEKLAAQDHRVTLVRMASVDGAKQFADESFDYVFIDANHSYEAVSQDLVAWYPKVKHGGVFAGHDYGNDTNWPNHCEVKKAVDEFMVANKLTFVVSRCPSWWTIKP